MYSALKIGITVAIICAGYLVAPFRMGCIPVRVAEYVQRLTPPDGIAAARTNGKPGSSFTVLKEVVADADTRRVADQALKQARAHHVNLFNDGILVDLLRSGGFPIAEYDPKTTNVIALHLVSLGPDGKPQDALYPLYGVPAKLADAEELVKDTAEFMEEFYSTPPSQASFLESRIYSGGFPEWCQSRPSCDLFGIPRSLLKLGADQSDYRELAALYGGFSLLGFQYAVSMPVFAATPVAAIQATENPITQVLRKNHLDPNFDLDLDTIRSKKQLRKRIALLRELDRSLQEAVTHANEADPALVKANISVAEIPLGFAADTENGHVIYSGGGASLVVIYWRRLPTGGFAVRAIGEAG